MIRGFGMLVFALVAWPGFGHSEETTFSSSTLQARNDVVGGFNAIGSHASTLRRAMKADDALAFDAVLEDVMSALLAIPGIAPRDPHPVDTSLASCRPDRVAQLIPDMRAMERFFARLSGGSATLAQRRMFRRAQQAATKMLAALPGALPTVDARTLAGPAVPPDRRRDQ